MIAAIISVAALTSAVAASPAEELRHDNRGRPVIGVHIEGRGPFDMVVDTAAQSSLIGETLAHELALQPADETLNVAGVTGDAQARLYPVKRFSSALFDLRDGALIALPNAGSTTAGGIVGMDLLAARKLVFDRANHRLTAEPSAPAGPGFVALKGRTESDTLLTVPVMLNGVAMQALVDTGAAVTLANPAALRAMGWKDDDVRLKTGGEIRGATADATRVRIGRIDRLTIGPATLRDVQVIFPGEGAFGDASHGPSVILGSDLLDLLDAFAVDLPRAELQVRVPGRAAPRP